MPQADEPRCGILELKTLFLCPTCQRSAETLLVLRTSILSSAGPGRGAPRSDRLLLSPCPGHVTPNSFPLCLVMLGSRAGALQSSGSSGWR